jgi:hypothetical protein
VKTKKRFRFGTDANEKAGAAVEYLFENAAPKRFQNVSRLSGNWMGTGNTVLAINKIEG